MRVPAQSRRSSEAAEEAQGPANAPYAWMRLRVLRTALAHERRPRWWPGRLPAPAALRPTLPVVWGLRLFPRAGGVDELALDRALSTVPGAVRAAFALQLLEGLSESGVRALLAEAGEADPAGRCAGRPGWGGRTGRGPSAAAVRGVRPVYGPDPAERSAAA
ncbi:hypothetical protein Smic_02740 [Streptomyces microflavus]|uniref:Uncharacterized protein n=1 Tax=Streptomyces microflavus TaxID=1919 RepID=A0A7J0CHE8_STRMI|nr:hypothetical protein Smic_02740 [Streptomyces microflavus]